MVWMVKTDKLLCEVLVFQVFELIFSTSFSSELQWVPSNKDGRHVVLLHFMSCNVSKLVLLYEVLY